MTSTLLTGSLDLNCCGTLTGYCIQNIDLGRCIVGYMIGNYVSDHIIDDIPPQMKILNVVIPILMHFLTFLRQRHSILHQTESSS